MSVGSHAAPQYWRAMREREPVHVAHHCVGEGYDHRLDIDAHPTDDRGHTIF